jgi:lipopolysaccharide export system permease protein
MKIIRRYITKELLIYILAVMFVWLSVYGLFNYLNEASRIGQENYTPIAAMIYVVLDLPSVAYAHSSVIILLGSILAMGNLASSSQLVVMQGSGISIIKIARIVIGAAITFIALIIVMGEMLGPIAVERAELYRAKALGENTYSYSQEGFWLRDGNNIINVKKNYDGQVFGEVSLFKLNSSNEMDSAFFSNKAIFDGNNLNLILATRNQLDENNKITDIEVENYEKYKAEVNFDRQFIESLKKKPKELSTINLYKQMNFLSRNKLSSGDYEVELYKRLIKPFTMVAMILLSMLFIFGSLRSATLGKKIFLGIMLSLFFELSSRVGGAISLSFEFNHLIFTSLPTIIILVFSLLFMYIKSIR